MDGHIVSASMCIRMGIIYHRMQWLIFLKVGYTQLTAGSLSNVISMLKILHKSNLLIDTLQIVLVFYLIASNKTTLVYY